MIGGVRFLAFATILLAFTAATASPVVEKVDTEFSGSDFITQLTFSESIVNDSLTVDFINETVQVNIPNASVRNGKILQRLRRNGVKSVYTYQFKPDVLRVRIIFDGIAASTLKESVQLQSDGKTLRIVTSISSKLAGMPVKVEKTPTVHKIKVKPQSTLVSDKKLKLKPEDIISEELKFEVPEPLVKANADLAESEIPLNLKTNPKEAKPRDASLKNIVYSVLILFAFAVFGFIYLKLYQRRGRTANKHTSIKMLTQHHLGPKKSLAIVQVAGESILIGITDHNISMIRSLSLLDEEVPEVTTENFDQMIETPAPIYGREGMPSSFSEPDEPEDFSVNSIKDLVKNKISGLREIR